ncbi:hypothetical protein GE09DRAFT_642293 [Coniochaeta sp. 2T2.1]|nr:hypothetical protein GE09DRAFT_642293 [Coniochaeta sp. 2T2.1]
MDRFNFLGRTPRAGTTQQYEFDDDDDRRQLSPRMQVGDIEAQQHREPEMAERSNTSRFMLSRWSRPTIPSFLSMASSRNNHPHQQQPRPSSSHYSGDTEADLDSPKTPRFPRLGVPNLPSTRLNLPHLTRTWTQGSNGPPSRPATAQHTDWTGRPISPSRTRFPIAVEVAEPLPTIPAEHGQRTRGHDGQGRRFSDPDEEQLAALAEDGRRRRQHRRGGSSGSNRSRDEGSNETRSDRRRRRRHRDCDRRDRGPPPKHFMFCFPWIKSRRIRSQILRCFVSGLFLTLLLTVYLALSITKNINSNEFTVLLILIILFVTIFFCHGLIRLCMLIVRAGKPGAEEEEQARAGMPQMIGPGGYAIPRQPIRVVLARDEEAAGIESVASKTGPPAYGLWRESVRVDPNRLYWMRNEGAPATVEEEETSSTSRSASRNGGSSSNSNNDSDSSSSSRTRVPRPPSYASDDGVSYVVEAQPRSIAPTTEVPLGPHPAEAGRTARAPAW